MIRNNSHSRNLKIGIVSDSRNQRIAEAYCGLLMDGAYTGAFCSTILFEAAHPEHLTEVMERQQVVLAHIGIPGRGDYQKSLHSFLEAFAAVKRKPPTGIITHDCDHTRYVIERWLGADARKPRDLPNGLVSIVDARRPLRPESLEKTVSILLSNAPEQPPRRSAIPFSQVRVNNLNHSYT